MTANQFNAAVTKDNFRPFRLVLKDGSEVHVLGNNYGLDRQNGVLFIGTSRRIAAADVGRVELLPYRVIDEDRQDIARARKALAEIKRRGLIPWEEVPRLLGLAKPKDGR
jgi:hypothetical protein